VSETHRFASDAEYLPELRRLLLDGRVRLDFDARRLRGMDSPVAVEAEVMWWALFILASTGLASWWQGWEVAAGVAAASGLIYVTLGGRWLARNLRRRIMAKALADIGMWRKLWRHEVHQEYPSRQNFSIPKTRAVLRIMARLCYSAKYSFQRSGPLLGI
jgi:hypothetical protein